MKDIQRARNKRRRKLTQAISHEKSLVDAVIGASFNLVNVLKRRIKRLQAKELLMKMLLA